MPLYNPHRNYDQGMDDAYMGRMPAQQNSQQYMQGYEYAEMLLEQEQEPQQREEQTRPAETEYLEYINKAKANV